MIDPRPIAESLLGPISWGSSDSGYCRCPGLAFHTHRNGQRDCRVMLNKVPTIHCVHSSCGEAVAEANRALRSAVGKAERGATGTNWTPRQTTPEEIERECQAEAKRRLDERSRKSLARIIADHRVEMADRFDQSPTRLLDESSNDWRLLLRLFPKDAVVWIGDTKDSCNDEADEERKTQCRAHFRTVTEWLMEAQAPGQFTCPSVFRPGIHSRSNGKVVARPFLVVESDTLAKEDIMAVFCWMEKFVRLRAIVDTAGKSLHGWFEFPDEKALNELRVMLPALGCDAALFKASQPCRLPGAQRGEKIQHLCWLDLEGLR